jgi:hypothetical protein
MKSWMCAARRGLFTSARWRRAAVGDVVFHRVVEQHRVLRHDADGRRRLACVTAADVLAVDR